MATTIQGVPQCNKPGSGRHLGSVGSGPCLVESTDWQRDALFPPAVVGSSDQVYAECFSSDWFVLSEGVVRRI